MPLHHVIGDQSSSKIATRKKIKDIYYDSKVDYVLQNNTSDAFKNDIFGVPTFFYNNQIFWGQDRIFFLEKEIKKSHE